MPTYKVRKGYTLFVGNNPYKEESVVECDYNQVKDQLWKVEEVKPTTEDSTSTTKDMKKPTVVDRMIKTSITKFKK
jgi:hypothetical protein